MGEEQLKPPLCMFEHSQFAGGIMSQIDALIQQGVRHEIT